MSEPKTDTGGMSQGGIGYSIRPAVAVPPTVLVADMGNGTMLLQGWQSGPSAYVCAADAGPLREALAVAFGSDLASTGRPAAVQAQP